MAPVQHGIANELRHKGGKGLELFAPGRIAGDQAFGQAAGAHKAPFIVIAAQPDFGNVGEVLILRDFLRTDMAVIIDNGKLSRYIVIQVTRGGRAEQKVFV